MSEEKICFFCDIQKEGDLKLLFSDDDFCARWNDFPVSPGHAVLFPRRHISSFFDLSDDEVRSFHILVREVKDIISQKFKPGGFNIGINEGKAAGQSQEHLHIHIIPRYVGDVENPIGGVCNVIPGRGDYINDVKEKFPEREKYVTD
ncbi:MAG: HIT domain-containing protein [Patescibacteria group bacterium]|nr:HIT domain-containing protein [Patescibacteria group bacterium]